MPIAYDNVISKSKETPLIISYTCNKQLQVDKQVFLNKTLSEDGFNIFYALSCSQDVFQKRLGEIN